MGSEPLDLAKLDEQIYRLATDDTDALRDLALALADELAQARARACGTRPEDLKAVSELIEQSRAEGYARAVAALRDDELYTSWRHAQAVGPAGARTHVDAVQRDVLADYLEVVAEGGASNG